MIDSYFLDIETLSIFSRDHILHLAARSRLCLRVIFSLNVTQEIPIIISGKNTKKTKWTVLKALIPVHCMKSISITFGFYHLSAGHQLQFPRGRLDKGLLQQQNILPHRQSWAGGAAKKQTKELYLVYNSIFYMFPRLNTFWEVFWSSGSFAACGLICLNSLRKWLLTGSSDYWNVFAILLKHDFLSCFLSQQGSMPAFCKIVTLVHRLGVQGWLQGFDY